MWIVFDHFGPPASQNINVEIISIVIVISMSWSCHVQNIYLVVVLSRAKYVFGSRLVIYAIYAFGSCLVIYAIYAFGSCLVIYAIYAFGSCLAIYTIYAFGSCLVIYTIYAFGSCLVIYTIYARQLPNA